MYLSVDIIFIGNSQFWMEVKYLLIGKCRNILWFICLIEYFVVEKKGKRKRMNNIIIII